MHILPVASKPWIVLSATKPSRLEKPSPRSLQLSYSVYQAKHPNLLTSSNVGTVTRKVIPVTNVLLWPKQREAPSISNTNLIEQRGVRLETIPAASKLPMRGPSKVDPITTAVFAHLGDLRYGDTDNESSEQASNVSIECDTVEIRETPYGSSVCAWYLPRDHE